MAVDFEIIDNNELQFGVGDPDDLEFGTRDIIEIRQSGDYEDLTNKPSINGVTLIGNKTTDELLIDVGVTSWNGQTGDVVYTPPEVPVQSVNGKTGAVVLNASDVGALPSSTAIPTKTSDLTNDSGYITGINSSDVTSALGYTPYNSTNPNGYVNATQAKNAAPVQSVNGQTGAVSLSIPTKTSDLTNDSGYITSAPVTSVNSKTGAVVLNASDVSALPSDTPIHNVPSGGTSGQVLTKSSNSDYAVEWSTPTGAVSSVNGQTGAVVLDAADVGALSDDTVIPSKVSQLQNDTGFITGITSGDVTSALGYTPYNSANPSGYVNSAQAASAAPVQSVNGQTGNVSLSIPTVPTNVSAFTNDAGYVNASGAAAAAPVQSVNGDTGAVVLDADDVGALPDDTVYALGQSTGGNAVRANGILYAQVDSTSTSTRFTATIPGVTEYYDGLTIMLKNGVVTSASGFTININGLGGKQAYSNLAAATADTTLFNINYTMLFVYDSTRVTGGGWICYRGYDANTNTIGYQLRTNSSTMPMKQITYRYRILFTSLDGQGWIPSNTSTSTNATAKRDVNQAVIDPFGEIVYYGTTASVAAGSNPSAASLWQEYTLTLGYAFNRTGAALVLPYPKPIYIKCAPQVGGGAIIDADDPYVFTLPSTEDGKIYIYLGRTYSATAIEMTMNHPVYYYKDGAIREWTNAAASGGGGAVDSVNGKTGVVVLDAEDVGALPDDTVIPTKTSDLTNDSGFVNAAGAASAAPVQSVNGQTGAVNISVPTKTSDLTNDSGFITSAPVSSVNTKTGAVVLSASDVGALPDSTTIPTKTSDLTNDSGFITSSSVPSASTTTPSMDGTASYGSGTTWARADHIHPTDTSRQATLVSGTNIKTVGGTSLLGSGNIALPTVPTTVSSFTNDAGYLTLATLPIYQGTVV